MDSAGGNGGGKSPESDEKRKSPGTWPDDDRMQEIIQNKAGIVTLVANAIDMTPRAVQRRIKADEKFALWFRESRDRNLDMSEAVIFEAIARKNLTATIFHLKCHGKHRGWVERSEVTGADGRPIGDVDPRRIAEGMKAALSDPEIRKKIVAVREQIDARTIALLDTGKEETPAEDAVVKH